MTVIHVATLMCLIGSIDAVLSAQQPAPLRGFSIVLLMGEAQGPMPTQGLSSSAQKALMDAREFLPYKGYRVLDTQWIAGSDFGRSKGRIHGVDEREYEFELETFPHEVQAKKGTPEAELSRARLQLVIPGPGFTPTGGRIGNVTVLDSSFAIKRGETVVVGTSRLKDNAALIVLLTAAVTSK